MKAKKLLAILLSLALLVGLMPVAGLLTTGAAEAVDLSETVYEISFTEGKVVSLGYYVSKGNVDDAGTTVYEISFDYFLVCSTGSPFTFNATALTGSTTLRAGRHTAKFTTSVTRDSNNAIDPKFTAASGATGTLYAWNLKVTANGTEITHYVHKPWYCACNDSCINNRTTATVTSAKTLADYDFAPNADGSVKVKTVYVDQAGGTGSDETGDGSESKPYASLYKAMQVIEATLYAKGEIIIIGDYTNANRYELYKEKSDSYYVSPTNTKTESPDYTKPVTIRGAVGKDTNHLYTTENSLWLFGPITFDDLTIQQKATSAGSCTFYGRHNEVTFGSGLALKGTISMVAGRSAPVYHALTTKQSVVVIDSASTFTTIELGKGYTVLLFMHIPFQWNSAELIYGDNLNANGLEKADGGATEQVYDLITANGDLVRGIFAGHVHDDIYSTVPATYVENGVTKNTTIPQFTLRGGFVAGGNMLKITVKDVADVDMTQKTTIEPVEGIDNGGVELYRLGDPETGLTVMEKTLNVGLGEGNELEIVQFNDTHLSASAPKTFANWNACIDYAQDNADYFVLNGDLVDTLKADTLAFVRDQLSIYDNCMAVMGNHEWFPKPCEDGEYDIIQQYWKNDVYYSSVVLKDKVMLISMDNSRFDSTDNTVAAFTADQLTKLTADLETAKAKGYAVLLFVHVPLGTNLTEGDATANFYTQNQNDAYYGNGTWNFNTNSPSIHHGDATTAAVCQKIADNADIIKGVFSAHYHSDFYVEIQGTNGTIPQYVNGAAKCDTGNVLKIVLK